MASSSTNNSNIRLKPRLCDCGRTTAIKKHCNYFKFADEDDDGAISTIRSDAGSRTTIRTEEFNDLRRRLGEMDNEFLEHDRRLQRMEKKFKAMTCVILND
ncbi:hypothetical protein CsSME_00024059 [Camellia sinensis var. sinensis]